MAPGNLGWILLGLDRAGVGSCFVGSLGRFRRTAQDRISSTSPVTQADARSLVPVRRWTDPVRSAFGALALEGGAWFFPARCELCGALGICPEHVLRFDADEPRCRRCAVLLPKGIPTRGRCAACQTRPLGLMRLVTVGSYTQGSVLRSAILALKHGGRPDLGVPLGCALADAWQRSTGGKPGREDCLVPVPLHPWRRWLRGYNQAALLAQQVAESSGVPARGALYRTRATPPQGSLGARSRNGNVSAAFAVHPEAIRGLSGRRVWLVDDVCTSGATLRACALALRRAGVRRVGALVLARVEPSG